MRWPFLPLSWKDTETQSDHWEDLAGTRGPAQALPCSSRTLGVPVLGREPSARCAPAQTEGAATLPIPPGPQPAPRRAVGGDGASGPTRSGGVWAMPLWGGLSSTTQGTSQGISGGRSAWVPADSTTWQTRQRCQGRIMSDSPGPEPPLQTSQSPEPSGTVHWRQSASHR